MPPLSSNLRSQLERKVIAARDVAEEGAWAALQRLAVDKAQPPGHLSKAERQLRVKLRARGRQLGDLREKNGEQDIYYLHRECAYEHWHQMLFARFLAENQLLMHPDGVAVSLEECEELAAEQGTDGWTLAARYASRMLPQIFRPDDPLLGVTFAPEDKQALEKLLSDLPSEIFEADDSLGWVYQFWQTKRKKEINDSGEKIGADELPAVTQLFTEDYMVKFLLHNTLGGWWAGKRLAAEDAQTAQSEQELRAKVALSGVKWEYLRFIHGEDGKGGPWRPAAGTFDSWPKQAAELKIMDPCCGSGHFLVVAFDLMVRIRMEEERFTAAEACDAVLRDNVHGLEIDPRCTQIAAFAMAFAAWTFPGAGGYRELPELHVACTGIAPQATEVQWIKLAEESGIPMPRGGNEPIRNGLINLHRLFSDAPTLGSLIDPKELPSDLIAADYETVRPYLDAVLHSESRDDETYERAIAARGIVEAAHLLAGDYTLVVTNVPYLERGNQDATLRTYLDEHYNDGKADLATAFLLRCIRLCGKDGTAAVVSPQNWLFLVSYTKLRASLLRQLRWNLFARLGPGAFGTISGHVVNVALTVLSSSGGGDTWTIAGIEASEAKQPDEKAALLRGDQPGSVGLVSQSQQLANPDSVIALQQLSGTLLSCHAVSTQGLKTGDDSRWRRVLWEVDIRDSRWRFLQSTVEATVLYGGREGVIDWSMGGDGMARLQGMQAWHQVGVAVKLMGLIPSTLYTGDLFDSNIAPITPNNRQDAAAIWCFCESGAFATAVRRINTKLNIAEGTVVKVPFDLDQWKRVAAENYPNGLPEPESDDPTQWLYHGCPEQTTSPLHVAVPRLLGYRWPAELDEDMRLSQRARALVRQCDDLLPFADADGIVCIPAVAGERTAADRLKSLLSACGVKPTENLDVWLRDKFVEEHCQLFHQRPFIWHIWDGRRKDGFHALVNYHKLDRRLLEKLIYDHLAEWIARQKGAESRQESGAEARRLAAEDLQRRLTLILEGEPPYDIFVRWKPLEEQPIGWDPDPNDGVRMNTRPFVNAGVLRKNPKIKWGKDRGKEPERPKDQYPWFWGWDEESQDFMGGPDPDGNRWNDCHYSNAVKQAARDAVEESKKQK